jgi:hypothetical protein
MDIGYRIETTNSRRWWTGKNDIKTLKREKNLKIKVTKFAARVEEWKRLLKY